MTLQEHIDINPNLRSFIKSIVADKRYASLKDAFVAHTPKGDNANPISTEVSHGMYLGTRHVFNEMETISRQPDSKKEDKKNNKGQEPEVDPDLES